MRKGGGFLAVPLGGRKRVDNPAVRGSNEACPGSRSGGVVPCMSQEVRACGRAQLARFLAREGMGEPEAAATLERLEPFFSAADDGCYPLSPGASIDHDAVAAAIAAATGRPVG